MRSWARHVVVVVFVVSFLPLSALPSAATSCIPAAGPGDVLVVRFAPALVPSSADLVDLFVAGEVSNLCGYELTDGEGTIRFHRFPVAQGDVVRLVSSADLVVPGDARVAATLVLGGDERLSKSGRFALAKGGDSLQVLADGAVVDAVVYGEGEPMPEGWMGEPVEASRVDRRVFLRGMGSGGAADTDSALDWTFPRIYRQHQEDRAGAWSEVSGETRAFLCPDRCFEEAMLRIDGAEERIEVNLYDLTLKEAVDRLVAAAERGVSVRVLVHNRPVGASAAAMDRLAWSLDRLTAAGAVVHTLEGLRFDVNHAKYLVVDGRWTTVFSENANYNGWAPDGRDGNRGWGVSVQDEGLASWMTALFVSDFSHPADARPVTGADLHPDAQPPSWGPVDAPVADRVPTLVVAEGVQVRPVVAPDHLGDPGSSPLVVALQEAQVEVWTQQLNLPLDWARDGYSRPSPLVTPMFSAAGRGILVRGTLGAAFEDGDLETPGNDRTAFVLSAHEQIALHLGDAPAGGLVHNKGWLIDPVPGGRNLAVVGSANGNLASQTLNREVDLFLEHPEVAAYFRAALLADWERARPAVEEETPDAIAGLPAPAPLLALVFLLLVIGVRRRRSFDMAPGLGRPRRR